ncbi:MAG: hypothetical protein ACYC7E_17275 [Armatimonadota bacterium]
MPGAAGVLLRYQNPLNFYRLVISATRGEIGLGDATGSYAGAVTHEAVKLLSGRLDKEIAEESESR